MTDDDLDQHCLTKPQVTAEHPFGPDPTVYKVAGKMFALLMPNGPEGPSRVNLKCEPELALVLRESYDAVAPGYHMNKKHWNTVTLDDSVDDQTIAAWIDDSYDLVLDNLPARTRDHIRRQL